jgi:tryptophan synthase alpha chain
VQLHSVHNGSAPPVQDLAAPQLTSYLSQLLKHCAGDPSLDATADALVALDAAGADVIELGMPYGDPLADGPTIQAAADRALRAGATLDKVLATLDATAPKLSAPLVLFTYYNVVMRRGLGTFCERLRAAGISALLVPDIPLEETGAIRKALNAAGLELVLLVAPTSGARRRTHAASWCSCSLR